MTLPENNWMIITAQVIFGIVVLILVYVITLVVLNIDAIIVNRSSVVLPKEESVIIDGYGTSSFLAKRSFNTINPYSDTFVKISRSVNRQGGMQFTYQFWINMTDVSSMSRFQNQVLLFKGDIAKYKYALYQSEPPYKQKEISSGADYLIACPLIKFRDSYKDLVVRFNTNKQLVYEANITMNTNNDITRRNVLSLLPLNWYLFTFVFEDNFSISETAENGIRFTFYMNDFPYHIVHASSDPILRNNFLRQNEGDLHIFPDLVDSNTFMKLGNVKYFNYALNDAEVQKHFSIGPPTHNANVQENRKIQPTYLSAYNKMDIYNY